MLFALWSLSSPAFNLSRHQKNLLDIPIQCYGNLTEDSHTRWRSRRSYPHPLLGEVQNYNLVLNNHQQENVGSHQKKIPHVQGQRRSPSKTVGGAKSCLESNPIPTRHTQRAQTNLVHTRTQRLTPELKQDWGNRLLEGTNKTCAHQDPGERTSEPIRD